MGGPRCARLGRSWCLRLAAYSPPSGAGPADLAPAAHAATAKAAPKPTIVLVHGAWVDASSWNGELDRLQREGYVVRALRGLTSDAAEVKDFLSTIPGPIVLAGHSYAGAVITNAAAAPDVGETNGQLGGKTSALSGNPATLFDSVPYAGAVQYYLKENIFLHNFPLTCLHAPPNSCGQRKRPAATAAFDTPSAPWEVPGGSHLTLISQPDAVTNRILAAARSVH